MQRARFNRDPAILKISDPELFLEFSKHQEAEWNRKWKHEEKARLKANEEFVREGLAEATRTVLEIETAQFQRELKAEQDKFSQELLNEMKAMSLAIKQASNNGSEFT